MASPDSEKPTLNDQTASNAIISRFCLGGQPYALGTMSNVGEDNRVDFNLVPGRRNMPDAGISLEQGEKGDRSGTFTVGNPDLRYTGKVRLPEDGGSSTRHRLEGGIGPFGAHYMAQGSRREIGGSLNIGPFTLFGNRATSQQNVIPEAYRGYFTNPNVDATSTRVVLGTWALVRCPVAQSARTAATSYRDLLVRNRGPRPKTKERCIILVCLVAYTT